MAIPDAAPPSPCRVRRDGREYVARRATWTLWLGSNWDYVAEGSWVVTEAEAHGSRRVVAVCSGPQFALEWEIIDAPLP